MKHHKKKRGKPAFVLSGIIIMSALMCFSCNTMNRNENLQGETYQNNSPTLEINRPNIYQESFLELAEALRTNHPGLLSSPLPAMSMDDFERQTKKTYEILANVDNTRDFFSVVSPYLSKFNDGHSSIFYGPTEKRGLPVSLVWIGDRLFISKTFDAQFSHLKGKEVIKIGEYDTADFEAKINALRQTDENNLFRLRKEQFGSNFFLMMYDTYAHFDMLEQDSVTFTLKEGNKIEQVSFPFIELEGITEEDFFVLARNPVTRSTYRNGFSVIDDLSTLYFQMGMDELSSKMIEDVFRTIRDFELENLVIDMRNSGGGAAAEAAVEFFDYLVPESGNYFGFRGWIRDETENREISNNNGLIHVEQVAEDLQFDGRLTVFTNGTTFSSGEVFVMMVRDNDFGAIWGEPCGSNVFRYGKRTVVPLSKIKMAASFSTAIWSSANSENTDRFIHPDVLVYQTIDHYLEGEDALWDYYRKQILEK